MQAFAIGNIVMNTEKLNSVREIRKILNEVNRIIPGQDPGTPERELFEQTAVVLEDLIWKLVNEDLKKITKDLKQAQSALKKLSDEIKEADSAFNKTGDRIERAAKIAGALTDMVAIAGSVGIL